MALLNYSFGAPPGAAPAPPPAPAPFLTAAAAAAAAASAGGARGGPPGVGGAPGRPSGYTRIDTSAGGSRTSLHAVIDYDDDLDDYYDDEEDAAGGEPADGRTRVTPIQGPIFVRNGSVPVVPLYSYPVLQNGSFVQIPILWTALSVALGLEIRGEIIRGVPCIKRFHQLFCPTAGASYPIERIELFIDENKALMKRMYGEFSAAPPPPPPSAGAGGAADYSGGAGGGGGGGGGGDGGGRRRAARPDAAAAAGDSYFRGRRQAQQRNETRVDACESKVEIVTPYWASNSAGKVRAIVNTQHFEQAIHQEVCSKVQTKRCAGDCGCEQKYKWHRLLAYDPDNDCKGIFMDWFLFPSCCVCRCAPIFGN
ncbi:hypothetical protein R5R35_002917 [Gryllus longicercus]|uniref:Spaetzle domain-containing protein n=1 Tax=Gryllus longicercus TaxID=2509291 RepID=A0AAN9VSG1_9ORTH